MLIVSQDGQHSINSEYLKEIRIYKNQIKCDLYEDYEIMLGEYGTEERTQEVFKEVVERHSNWENLKYGQPSGICNPKYRMPKE